MSKSSVEKSKNIASEFKRIVTRKRVEIQPYKKKDNTSLQDSKDMYPKHIALAQPKKRVKEEVDDSHWVVKASALHYKGKFCINILLSLRKSHFNFTRTIRYSTEQEYLRS